MIICRTHNRHQHIMFNCTVLTLFVTFWIGLHVSRGLSFVPAAVEDPNSGVRMLNNAVKRDVAEAELEIYTTPAESVHLKISQFSYLLTPVKLVPECVFVVYVLSVGENKERRDLIRRTYADKRFYTESALVPEVMFVLGVAENNSNSTLLLRDLIEENAEHGDLLVGSFADTYLNLTWKGVYAMHWIENNLPQVQYAIKTDDDVFLNTFAWLELIGEWTRTKSGCHHSLPCAAGFVWRSNRVERVGKWAITTSMYSESRYPPYCAGSGYLLTAPALRTILYAYRQVPFVPWEDAFFTGIVAKATGIQHFNTGRRADPYTRAPKSIINFVLFYKHYLCLHNIKVDIYEKAWAVVTKHYEDKNPHLSFYQLLYI